MRLLESRGPAPWSMSAGTSGWPFFQVKPGNTDRCQSAKPLPQQDSRPGVICQTGFWVHSHRQTDRKTDRCDQADSLFAQSATWFTTPGCTEHKGHYLMRGVAHGALQDIPRWLHWHPAASRLIIASHVNGGGLVFSPPLASDSVSTHTHAPQQTAVD